MKQYEQTFPLINSNRDAYHCLKMYFLKQQQVKKLMRTNFALFQDSPDDNYEAAPVKSFEQRQEKKSIINAAKSTKKISKIQDTSALNIYDFDAEPEVFYNTLFTIISM